MHCPAQLCGKNLCNDCNGLWLFLWLYLYMEWREKAWLEGNSSPYATPQNQERSSLLPLLKTRSKASLPSRSGAEHKSAHDRRRRIMPDGSLLFPEGGGELPPYANARNWPRPPSHFSTRSLTIIICCTRDRCRTVHYKLAWAQGLCWRSES